MRFILRLVFTLTLLCAFEIPLTAQWDFADQLNVGRAGLATAKGADGVIYALGGTGMGDPDVIATVEVYNLTTNTWTFRASMPTPRTALAAATANKGKIYAFGGCPASHGYIGMTTVEIYDPASNTWTTGAPMPTARTGHKAITGRDGRIYVIGGYDMNLGHLNVVEVYDPITNLWSTAAPMPTARQQFGASLGVDGRIYVIGGSDNWRSGIMTTVEIYDPVTNTWSTGASMPTPRDGLGAATSPDGRIYAMGGWTGNYPHFGDVIRTVEVYDPITDQWSAGPPLLVPEYGPGTVTGSDCRIYSIAGGDYGVSTIVQRLTVSTNTRRSTRFKCGIPAAMTSDFIL